MEVEILNSRQLFLQRLHNELSTKIINLYVMNALQKI